MNQTPIQLPLSLRRRASHVDAGNSAAGGVSGAAAWFIPGADPGMWLEEIARWDVPSANARLFVLPASPADLSPIGVLAVLEKVRPAKTLLAQPYRVVGGRLYLPADAALWPPVADAELAALPLAVYVFHPSAGLSGFAAGDALAVSALIEPPADRGADWGVAVAGDARSPRVFSVEPPEEPTADDVLSRGRDDIGSTSPASAPLAKDESKLADAARRGAAKTVGAIGSAVTAPLSAMTKLLKSSGAAGSAGGGAGASDAQGTSDAGKSWVERLRDWARRPFDALSRKLAEQREREIDRLRELLEKNPDEGLRYALSLHGGDGSRGVAPPSGSLSARNVDFSLGSLRGGQAADNWDLSYQQRQRLMEQYRQAANREIRLGRHRRAAYILAHLLGDFPAAASALEQGRHFREAAALYREKVKNRELAAKCLERGGLLAEAAEEYEALQRYEAAAGLYERLERRDDATRCYRMQVSAYEMQARWIPAARLLESKLGVPDEALALLGNTWPGRDADGACLAETFAMLGRLGRHAVAAKRVSGLSRDPLDAPCAGRLNRTLADVARNHVDTTVRSATADAVRVVAARFLRHADADRAAVARAVATATPEDRLLARDAQRYLQKPLPGPQPYNVTSRAAAGVTRVREIALPPAMRWSDVVAVHHGFVAAGAGRDGNLLLFRSSWSGEIQCVGTGCTDADGRTRLHIVPGRADQLMMSGAGGRRVMAWLAATQSLPAMQAHEPAWIPPSTLLMANAPCGMTWTVNLGEQSRLSLSGWHTDSGNVASTYELPTFATSAEWPLQMVAGHRSVFLGYPNGVRRCPLSATEPLEEISLDGDLIRLVPAPPDSPIDAIAVADARSVVLWRDGSRSFLDDMSAGAAVGFSRRGDMVVVEPSGVMVLCQVEDSRLTFKSRSTVDVFPSPLRAVLPTNPLDGFATFAEDGSVVVWKVEG